MGFDYSYEYFTPSFALEGAAAVLGILLVISVLTIGLGIVMYVFQSLGLYAIADRRGIRKPWLAWIPLGNMWIMGSICDQYQYVVKGKVRNRRKTLLGLTIGLWVALLLYYAFYFVGIIGVVTGLIDGNSALAMVPLVFVLAIAMLVLAILLTVFQYIALYDVYTSCSPDSGVLMLVLSIFFNVTMPFFLFAIRKKDGGMPPRKPPVEPVYQPLTAENTGFTEE